MTRLDEVFKEFERVNKDNLAPISNTDMQQAHLIYHRRMMIAKIKYYLKKIYAFLLS